MSDQIRQSMLLRNVVLKVLREAPGPVNANEIFDKPEVREVCDDRNKISVLLSDLWRSKPQQAHRVPTRVLGTNLKYAYAATLGGLSITPPTRDKRESIKETTAPAAKPKPQITVTEHLVTIELDTIRITVEV